MSRECGDCTKCCEGFLVGSVQGKDFYPGKPCHFIEIGKGCTIYKDRPVDPCKRYKCGWLVDEEMPEWLKPNQSNVIIDVRDAEGIPFINVIEAGETLRSDVLSWLITNALNKAWNLRWTIKDSSHWIGSQEFLVVMEKTKADIRLIQI
jgi:hypothetical protein